MFIFHIKAFTWSRVGVPRMIPKSTIHIRAFMTPNREENEERKSVTGTIYEVEGNKSSFPVVTLYTKEGCTLCDKVTDVLQSVRGDYPHSLEAVDITDEDNKDIYEMYKWDIPVLKINGLYWTKHRLEQADAKSALRDAASGKFIEKKGEPNASAMEQRVAQRKIKEEK